MKKLMANCILCILIELLKLITEYFASSVVKAFIVCRVKKDVQEVYENMKQEKVCKNEKETKITLIFRQLSHWRTFWKQHASWVPRISFVTSRNPVYRKNGPGKEYWPCLIFIPCSTLSFFIFYIYFKAFTLFAPTNEAFANIPRELRARVDSFRGNIENPMNICGILMKSLFLSLWKEWDFKN